MENKYYIPELEELFIGYKCEWNNPNEDDIWRGTELDRTDMWSYVEDVENNLDLFKIRSKFLDKEDIESLGWKFKELSSNLRRERYIIPHNNLTDTYYQLSFLPEESVDIIIYEYFPAGNVALFQGECKSINELKKLMKWLKIA